MKKFYLKKMLMAVITLLCSVVANAYDFEVDGIYYKVTSYADLTVNVTYKNAFQGEYSGDVVIPEKVSYNENSYSVTSIGEYAFLDCDALTSITIPNSVATIEYRAFYGCSGLTSIEIPNSVTSIGADAFYKCRSLTSVTIGNSVTIIGGSAFSGCGSLTSIVVESGNSVYDSRDNCNAIIETATNTLIAGCKNTIIPGSVTIIGDYAFQGCSSLTSVTIPNSVTSIGGKAFADCSGLTSVTIPNSVTSIGVCAFDGCSGLTSVTIGNSVTSIEEFAFYGCNGLTSVTIPNSVTNIGEFAFSYCRSLASVTIGNSVTSIGGSAFSGCGSLTSVTIGNSVTSIGQSAFKNCSGLTSVYVLNENPAEIHSTTFSNYDATLYVPQGSIETYKVANYWNKFTNIVEFDATAIEDIENDAPVFEITASGILFTGAEGKAVAVYTASGALVEKIDAYAGEEIALDKGVYIVRVAEKSVKVKL